VPRVDTLIQHGILVTGDHDRTVVQADLLIHDDKIAKIMAPGTYSRPVRPTRIVNARGCAVIPGLVQTHVHLCQTLMRGFADDLPLLTWLRERIWPLEAAHDDASLTASAELGLLEMMQAGTTTILDMGTVHGQDAVMEACLRSGIRAFSGKAMMDAGEGVPKRLRESTKSSLRESDRLAQHWEGKGDGRIRYAYAPRFILSCTEKLFRALSDRMREDTPYLFHSHAAEHPDEKATVRQLLGADDVDVLARLGFQGTRVVLAHGVQLSEVQMRHAARVGTRFVHCPSANLKLGSGIAKVAKMQALGMQLGLGADGAPCNNTMDPWVEMRSAALLSKITAGTTSLPAEQAFRLATIDGAKVLGIDARIGSLEVGKLADIAVVNIEGAHTEPGTDVYSKLVYACRATDVRDVFVSGQHIVDRGEHQRLETSAVTAKARMMARAQQVRAGLRA
jgi:5-methylthioadenosine/S-adenosylhomocysteine deaminase